MKLLPSLIAALTLGVSALAPAADFPTRPLKLIVPYPPGGAGDLTGRIVAEGMASRLGQPVVVENRAGANTAIGLQAVVSARPDGYTIGLVPSGLTILPFTQKGFSVDLAKGFRPISMISTGPMVLTTNAATGARTLPEFVALARHKPGKLNNATSGATDALVGEYFKLAANVDITTVPYKGGAPALQALLSNEVQFAVLPVSAIKPYLETGALRALAVTSARATPLLPQVKPVSESGYPGFDAGFWFGLIAPPGTPSDAVARLNQALRETLGEPRTRGRLQVATGTEAAPGTPEQFARRISDEYTLWGKVVTRAGINPE